MTTIVCVIVSLVLCYTGDVVGQFGLSGLSIACYISGGIIGIGGLIGVAINWLIENKSL